MGIREPFDLLRGIGRGRSDQDDQRRITFTQLFDDKDNASMGDLVVAPSDPNILYLGTGEEIRATVRRSATASTSRSMWTYLAQNRAREHREDPPHAGRSAQCRHRLCMRTRAHLGPNEDRGLYKTTDGGKTWRKILYKNDLTGCSDVDIDPNNANIVYAGMYTHRRYRGTSPRAAVRRRSTSR